MKESNVVLVFLLFWVFSHSNAQTFQLGIDYTRNYQRINYMENMHPINSVGIRTSLFPFEKIPVGLTGNITMGRNSIYNNRTLNSQNPDLKYGTDTMFTLRTNFRRYCIGIKIANQNSERIINPFFSSMIGFGASASRFKLFERYFNDDPEHTGSFKRLNHERLLPSRGGVYKFEVGLELGRKPEYGALIYISYGIVGSFNNFQYFDIHEISQHEQFVNQSNLETYYYELKANIKNHEHGVYNTKLYLHQFSFGIILNSR